MVISHRVVMNKKQVMRDSTILAGKELLYPEEFYRDRQWSYPRFFKMDKLCKWACAGAELLFSGDGLYKEIDKNKIGIVLATSHGCLDVDKRYLDSIEMPSPALFVYTLPNIMLGEICIRHGFKGSQLCMESEQFDAEEIYFTVNDLLENRGMDACLCGWADAAGDEHDVCLFWVVKGNSGDEFTPGAIQALFEQRNIQHT